MVERCNGTHHVQGSAKAGVATLPLPLASVYGRCDGVMGEQCAPSPG